MLHHNNSAGAFAKTLFGALILACAAAPLPAVAEDILVTQYKADPSGAPYGVAIDKGFFKAAGVDITGVISGEGGGSSVRAVLASDSATARPRPPASSPPSTRARTSRSSISARGRWRATSSS